MNWLWYVAAAVAGYFLGNFSSGSIVARLFGLDDIRKHGSGNPGTTNVMRTLGVWPAVLTFVGDVLKAVIAVLIGFWADRRVGGALGEARLGGMLAGFLCVIGHNWPVLMRFHGGKGMATSFGTILVLDPPLALIVFCCQLIVLFATKYMSVASICSTLVLVISTAILHPGDWLRLAYSAILCLMAIYCHRSNIKRLREGTENKLNFGSLPHSKMK